MVLQRKCRDAASILYHNVSYQAMLSEKDLSPVPLGGDRLHGRSGCGGSVTKVRFVLPAELGGAVVTDQIPGLAGVFPLLKKRLRLAQFHRLGVLSWR